MPFGPESKACRRRGSGSSERFDGGPIRAGESVIPNVRWTEHIGRTGADAASSSEYQISGDFDANDLERLGYPVARYAQGRIGVTVTGQGRGFDVDNARIDLDLRNAAVELPRGLRVNCVSPGVLEESMENYGPFFRGYEPVPARRVALAYSKSVEGAQTGQVYRVA